MDHANQRVVRGIAIGLIFLSQAAFSQLPAPVLNTIYPPGGKAGSELTVTLTGTDLDDPVLKFTHAEITAEPVMIPADRIWPDARQDGLKFRVHIGPNVEPGAYEAHVVGRFGISTPRIFMVGPFAGSSESLQGASNETLESASTLQLEQVVNGTCPPNSADFYRITAQKNQRILVHCWASRIDSRMDASLTILDSAGQEIAKVHDTMGRDPIADFIAPVDGEYIVKVHDFLFGGGSSFFYRLVASTRPHIDAIYPAAALPETQTRFTIIGRNLPESDRASTVQSDGTSLETMEIDLDVPSETAPPLLNGSRPMRQVVEGFNYGLAGSNSVRVAFARSPVIEEDRLGDEQVVAWPCSVAGKFDFTGDVDYYRFSAKKGQEIWIEVISERLGVSSDPSLLLQQIVRAEDGTESHKVLKEGDDFALATSMVGFDARTFDVGIPFVAPADGEYRVRISNQFGTYGPLQIYQLTIREAHPDFALLAIADSNYQEARTAGPGFPFLQAGGTVAVRVVALRSGGLEGPIDLVAEGLPEGVTASPAQIWPGQTETRIVLRAAETVADWAGEIQMMGKHAETSRMASVGILTWAAKDYSKERLRSRVTTSLPLMVSSEKALLSLAPKEAKTWEVEIQKQLDLPIVLTKSGEIKGNVTITPYGLPEFRRPPSVNVAEKEQEGILKISFRVDGNNRPSVSEGRFLLSANGVIGKYRTNPEAVSQWQAWQKAIEENAKVLVTEKSQAEADLKAAEAALAEARENLTAASAESKAELETAVMNAETVLAEANKSVAELVALTNAAESAKKTAAAELKKAQDRAKERDVKFTVYSEPIPLKIVAPPTKP